MSGEAETKLAGCFLEWQRIEDAKDDLAEQSKELFKAMKAEGFDTKAMRAVFREKRFALDAKPEDIAKANEAEAIADLYRVALDKGLSLRARPASARVENIEKFPDPHPPTGDGGRPQSSDDAGAKNDVVSVIVGRVPAGSIPYGQSGQQQASAPQDRNPPVSESGAAATHSNPQPTSRGVPPQVAETRDAGAPVAAASPSSSPRVQHEEIDLTIPESLRRTA